jgi:uncharacterized protein (DUF362 family)/Pyruvate/2-oxoacid:ferredoxin oxidoreductase delta subunit
MHHSTVALIRCSSYEPQAVQHALARGLALLGGIEQFIGPAERIVLKPNLLYGAEPAKCVTTHPAVFEAVALACQGAQHHLCYGDSSAPIATAASLRKTGIDEVGQRLGLERLNCDTPRSVSFEQGRALKRLVLSEQIMACDGLISIAKCKTHNLTLFTGAIKNQYGCVPGLSKGHYHTQFPDVQEFAQLLVDINRFLKPRLYILDAIIAMEGNGPGSGTPRALNALLLSSDPVALDATACRIIALPPEYVPTISAGEQAGLGTYRSEQITVVGDTLEDFVVSDFDVIRRPPLPLGNRPLFRAIKRALLSRPVITAKKCRRCGKCIEACPVEPRAVNWTTKATAAAPRYDYNRCIRCLCCNEVCPYGAIAVRTPLLGRLMPMLNFVALGLSALHYRRNRLRHD